MIDHAAAAASGEGLEMQVEYALHIRITPALLTEILCAFKSCSRCHIFYTGDTFIRHNLDDENFIEISIHILHVSEAFIWAQID